MISGNSRILEKDGTLERIINSMDYIKGHIELIKKSKDILEKDDDLIAFTYLLGYFTSNSNGNISNDNILSSILEFSNRKKLDKDELFNKIKIIASILNNNLEKEDEKSIKSKNKYNNKLNLKDNNSFISLEIKKNDKDNLSNSSSFFLFNNSSLYTNNDNYDKKNKDYKNGNNIDNDNNEKKNNNIINVNESGNKIIIDLKKEKSFIGKKTYMPQKIKNCDICFEDFNEYDSLNYELKCGCIIHYECFDDYIKNSVENNEIPILCPCCKAEVYPNLIYDSLITNGHNDLVKKYEKFSLNNYLMNHKDSYSCCPTPGCEYMFFFEEGENRFLCPMCNKEYCLFCKETWHKGMTCQEYIDSKDEKKLDEKFLNFVKGARFKICPNCRVWVEKVFGCDNMHCKCGVSFCYRCGKIIPPHIHDCPCWKKKKFKI